MKLPRSIIALAGLLVGLVLAVFLLGRKLPAAPLITLTHLGPTNVGGQVLVLFSAHNTNAFHVGYGMAVFSPPNAARPQPFFVPQLSWRGEPYFRPWQGVASNSTVRFAIARPILPGRWQLRLFCRPVFRQERVKDKVSDLLRRWGLGPLSRPLVDDPVVVASPEFEPLPGTLDSPEP